MRYLEVVGEHTFRLINDRKSKVTVYYNSQPLAEGVGELEFRLKSMIINPIVELHYEDGFEEYAGVQYINTVGIENFRDIGGYTTDEGKQIKFREFYRGAAVVSQGEDLERLTTLSVKNILDFRSSWEVDGEPDVEVSKANNIQCPAMKSMDDFIESKNSLNIAELEKQFVGEDPIQMMKTLYKDLIFNNSAYKKMFELIEDGETPLVFHCSAGKDRTGVATAFIMLALGVDRKQVEEEYLLTNVYRRDAIKQFADEQGISFGAAEAVAGVKIEYLDLVFDMIAEKYPSIDAYLEGEFGLTQERRSKLKDRYTI